MKIQARLVEIIKVRGERIAQWTDTLRKFFLTIGKLPFDMMPNIGQYGAITNLPAARVFR